MSDAAVDTSSEITTKDLKEKKEVVEEAENGRDAPANGNANEENGEQEADNEVDEEEEEGGEEEEEEEEGDGEKRMEMKMRKLSQLRASGQLKMMRMTMLIPRSRRPTRMTRQQKRKS
ncbi:prothymosin alpha isoform X1 [Theropithecus gelada]|uniref:prothymosin alpha isoform X1 n=1 Tax=Theropithecus gelada TaxID=9565 RepID=UPI000DC186AD|nr:prothymosin alpha isoform X1 [Theropithecus gelada]